MANLNKVFLIGNLTRDPELRYTPSGMAVANLRLAVNSQYKDKQGEVRKETCFVTIVVWNKQAEAASQFLQKGSPVFVEGRLLYRTWEDTSGQKRNVLEVRADRVQFLGPMQGQRKETQPIHEPQMQDSTEQQTENIDTSWLDENIDKDMS